MDEGAEVGGFVLLILSIRDTVYKGKLYIIGVC